MKSLAKIVALLSLAAATALPAAELAFPGAQGWAASTPGGRGGRIIRVTTLAPDGPGSFLEALNAKGPRIVVFEVGGVIDLGRREPKIVEPFLTIAGQTAPGPGITFIRGGFDINTHDVVIRHIRVRVGRGGAVRGTWEPDGISTVGGWNIIVDHCSLTWAIDENLSASGPRFTGATPDDWRRGTSHAITFSNNIIAEGLAHASHAKGEHSKGSLIHDNVSGILIVGNLYAHNQERSPLFKGGVRGAVVNNLIYDPGARAIHYNLLPQEWAGHPYEVGELSAVGNVVRGGESTSQHVAFLMTGGAGELRYFARDNIAVDAGGKPMAMRGTYTTDDMRVTETKAAVAWPEGLTAMPAAKVQAAVLANAGARPWARDANDWRVIADTVEGRGEVIDDESQVGGYPVQAPVAKPFVEADWDMATMEPKRPDVLQPVIGKAYQ